MMPGAADNFIIHTNWAGLPTWPAGNSSNLFQYSIQMARHDTWLANRLLISIQITLTSSLGSSGLALGLGAANNLIILFK